MTISVAFEVAAPIDKVNQVLAEYELGEDEIYVEDNKTVVLCYDPDRYYWAKNVMGLLADNFGLNPDNYDW